MTCIQKQEPERTVTQNFGATETDLSTDPAKLEERIELASGKKASDAINSS